MYAFNKFDHICCKVNSVPLHNHNRQALKKRKLVLDFVGCSIMLPFQIILSLFLFFLYLLHSYSESVVEMSVLCAPNLLSNGMASFY